MQQRTVHTLYLAILAIAMVAACTIGARASSEYYYTGAIQAQTVQMDITFDHRAVTGSYFYDSTGVDIKLKGQTQANGAVSISEFDANGKKTGVFTGTVIPTYRTFTGTWRSEDGKEQFPFKLTAVAEYITVLKSLPRAKATGIYPRFYAATPALNGLSNVLRARIGILQQNFLTTARANLKVLPAYFNLSQDFHYNIKYYSPDLISMVAMLFEDDGGAHPNTTYESMNVRITGNKAISFKLMDLFTPDYLPKLSTFLVNNLHGQGAQWVLNGQIKQFKPTDLSTFYLRPTAMVFIFSPYAVGPYVQGTFMVRVPYTYMAEFVDAKGPIKRFVR